MFFFRTFLVSPSTSLSCETPGSNAFSPSTWSEDVDEGGEWVVSFGFAWKMLVGKPNRIPQNGGFFMVIYRFYSQFSGKSMK